MKIIKKITVLVLTIGLVFGCKAHAQVFTNSFELVSLSEDSPLRLVEYGGLGPINHQFCPNPPVDGVTQYDNNPGHFFLEIACGVMMNGYYFTGGFASGGAFFSEGTYENATAYGFFEESGPRMSIWGPGVYTDVVSQRFVISYISYAPDSIHIDGLSIFAQVTRASGEIDAFSANFNVPVEFAQRSALSMVVVPEPSTGTLAILGVLALTGSRRFRHKK